MRAGAIALPLCAALIYALATLFIKRTISRGGTARQLNFYSNLAMALMMQGLLFWSHGFPGRLDVEHALLCGGIFFVGQFFTFAALKEGDISVATPLLGTKVLFVAGLGALIFGVHLSWRWWIAAGICATSIMLITGGLPHRMPVNVLRTVLLAGTSAGFYGLTDLLIQQWCRPQLIPVFFAVMFFTTGVLTCAMFLSWKGGGLLPVAASRGSMVAGVSLLSIQILVFVSSIGLYGDATAANVLYSSRALWSIVLAWTIGEAFGARDALAGPRVMVFRLCGSFLLFCAIIFILA